MYQRPEVLAGLHVDEEDRHHQVEAGSAEADSVDCRVANQHFAVAAAVRLVTHHVEERHLQNRRKFTLLTEPGGSVSGVSQRWSLHKLESADAEAGEKVLH